jgi:MFS family permease
VIGPVITGYISVIGWRWSFWIGLIVAVLTLPIVILSPETYEPVLLRNRARRLRKETGIDNIASPIELENRGVRQMITVALARPFRMLIHESIVLFCCLYLSLVYAIFFLYFQTYPIIFQGTYLPPFPLFYHRF